MVYDEVQNHEDDFDHLVEILASRERTSISVINNGGVRRLYACIISDWGPELSVGRFTLSDEGPSGIQEDDSSSDYSDYDWRRGGYYGALYDNDSMDEWDDDDDSNDSEHQGTPDNSRPPGLVDSVSYPSLESAIDALMLIMGYPTTGVAAENISPKFSMRSFGSTLAVHSGQGRMVDIGDMGPALQAACALVEGGRSSDADILATAALIAYLTGHTESDIPLLFDDLKLRIDTSRGFVKQGLKKMVQTSVSYLGTCRFKAPITESRKVEEILSLHPRGSSLPASRQIAIVAPKSAVEVVKLRGKLNLNDLYEGEVDILDFLSSN
jgi:hypothetical protein